MVVVRRVTALSVVMFVAVAVVVGSQARPASACSCSADPLEVYVADVEFAFIGRQVDRAVLDEMADNGAQLTFEVEEVFKGSVAETVTVRTHAQSSACGLDLANVGVTGVAVFMWRGQPSVNLCGSMVTAEDLQRVFGAGRAPGQVAEQAAEQSETLGAESAGDQSNAGGTSTTAVVVTTLAGAGLIVIVTAGSMWLARRSNA